MQSGHKPALTVAGPPKLFTSFPEAFTGPSLSAVHYAAEKENIPDLVLKMGY